MDNPIQARVEQFKMPHPSGTGNFEISVSYPANWPADRKNLPLLFVLDANIAFGLAAEIARLRGINGGESTAVVVGVGYKAAYTDFVRLRTADLTPPLSDAGRQLQADLANVIGKNDGGADAFLTFLTDTLVPEILRRYPQTSPSEHILFGHSLGGLFAAYALLTRPQCFSVFLCSSPSLWWDGFAILGRLPDFAERLRGLDCKPRVLVCVGAKEQEVPTKVPESWGMSLEAVQALVATSRMVDAAAEFSSSLRNAGLDDVNIVAFADEDHGTVIPAAINRGLTFALPER